jgi:hypothetical protein
VYVRMCVYVCECVWYVVCVDMHTHVNIKYKFMEDRIVLCIMVISNNVFSKIFMYPKVILK